MPVSMFNKHKHPENRNGEKDVKAWNRRKLLPRPGVLEKALGKNFAKPYRDPRRVSLAQ